MPNRSAWPVPTACALALVAAFGLLAPGTAGPIILAVGPTLFPGLLVVSLCLPRAGALERWTIGAALSPLVVALVGWAGVRAGLAPATMLRALTFVAVVGAIATEAALARRATPAPQDGDGRARRAVALMAILAAAAVALPPLVNRWILVRSDAWVHGALVWELLLRGFPPQDNWFAGIMLNYVWFFDWYVALLTSVSGHDPFVFMAVFNVVNFAVLLGLIYRLALAIGQSQRAAAWSVALTLFGLNAGAWILWPLRGLRGLTGQVHGWVAVVSEYKPIPFGTWRILYPLVAPFAHMVNLYDKFMVGTALSYAWLLMLVVLLAGVRFLSAGARGWLVLAALAALGTLLFHGVVGMSALPVLACAIALAWAAGGRLPWLGARARMLRLAAAVGLGGLLGVPYTRAIMRGWSAGASGLKHSYLAHDPYMAWTLLTATGIVAALAVGPVRAAWRERRGPATVFALWTLGMYLFAALVDLPADNESKFTFQAFFGAVVFAGAGVPAAWRWAVGRIGRPAAITLAAILSLVGPVLTVEGFAADPEGRTDYTMNVPPGDEALDTFIRERTPVDAVIVDRDYRDWIMVLARRRMYCGSPEGPSKFGFPANQVVERHRVIDDLYGPRADVAHDAETMARLAAPIYVVDRPPAPGQAALTPLDMLSPRFARVYDRDGRRLYRLVQGDGTPAKGPTR